MRLEDQVCTESQGIRLEELGVHARPPFAHCWVTVGPEDAVKDILLVDDKNTRIPELATTWIAPAYTVAELLAMLPANSSINNGGNKFFCRFWWGELADNILRDSFQKNSTHKNWHQTTDENPAAACASMLIFLLENKLISPEQVNKSLK